MEVAFRILSFLLGAVLVLWTLHSAIRSFVLPRSGVPLKADRDQAWRHFAGWRVNYDAVLRILAGLTMAPRARWSGDRPILMPVRLFSRSNDLTISNGSFHHR